MIPPVSSSSGHFTAIALQSDWTSGDYAAASKSRLLAPLSGAASGIVQLSPSAGLLAPGTNMSPEMISGTCYQVTPTSAASAASTVMYAPASAASTASSTGMYDAPASALFLQYEICSQDQMTQQQVVGEGSKNSFYAATDENLTSNAPQSHPVTNSNSQQPQSWGNASSLIVDRRPLNQPREHANSEFFFHTSMNDSPALHNKSSSSTHSFIPQHTAKVANYTDTNKQSSSQLSQHRESFGTQHHHTYHTTNNLTTTLNATGGPPPFCILPTATSSSFQSHYSPTKSNRPQAHLLPYQQYSRPQSSVFDMKSYLLMILFNAEPSLSTALSTVQAGTGDVRRVLESATFRPRLPGLTKLVSQLTREGHWQKGFEVFETLSVLSIAADTTITNAAISACDKGGQWERALQVFHDMEAWGLQRDAITYSAMISALSKGRQWSLAIDVFNHMCNAGIECDAVTCCSLITALDKGGQWQLAEQVFIQMYQDHPTFKVLLHCMDDDEEAVSTASAGPALAVSVQSLLSEEPAPSNPHSSVNRKLLEQQQGITYETASSNVIQHTLSCPTSSPNSNSAVGGMGPQHQMGPWETSQQCHNQSKQVSMSLLTTAAAAAAAVAGSRGSSRPTSPAAAVITPQATHRHHHHHNLHHTRTYSEKTASQHSLSKQAAGASPDSLTVGHAHNASPDVEPPLMQNLAGQRSSQLQAVSGLSVSVSETLLSMSYHKDVAPPPCVNLPSNFLNRSLQEYPATSSTAVLIGSSTSSHKIISPSSPSRRLSFGALGNTVKASTGSHNIKSSEKTECSAVVEEIKESSLLIPSIPTSLMEHKAAATAINGFLAASSSGTYTQQALEVAARGLQTLFPEGLSGVTGSQLQGTLMALMLEEEEQQQQQHAQASTDFQPEQAYPAASSGLLLSQHSIGGEGPQLPQLFSSPSHMSPLQRTSSAVPYSPMYQQQRSLLRTSSLNTKKSAPNRVCCNALLAAYTRAQPCQWRRALHLLELMWQCGGELCPDIVSYNTVIKACGNARQVALGYRVYHVMRHRGVEATVATFGTLICISSDAHDNARVKEAWGWLRSSGMEVHITCANAYLQALINENDWSDAKRLFHSLAQPYNGGGLHANAPTYSIMMSGYAAKQEPQMVIQTFEQMREAGIQPSGGIFTMTVTAYAQAGLWDEAIRMLNYLCRPESSSRPSLIVFTSLFQLIQQQAATAATAPHQATQLIALLSEKLSALRNLLKSITYHQGSYMHIDSAMCQAMIGAYEATGHHGTVIELFNLMIVQGVMIEEQVSGVVLRSLTALEQWGKVEQLIKVMQDRGQCLPMDLFLSALLGMTALGAWITAYLALKAWLLAAMQVDQPISTGITITAPASSIHPITPQLGPPSLQDLSLSDSALLQRVAVMRSTHEASHHAINGDAVLSQAPSTINLLQLLQAEGHTDELLMALLIIREAGGAWIQAADMFRWMQKSQPSAFTLSKDAHTIMFELMFKCGEVEGLRHAVLMCKALHEEGILSYYALTTAVASAERDGSAQSLLHTHNRRESGDPDLYSTLDPKVPENQLMRLSSPHSELEVCGQHGNLTPIGSSRVVLEGQSSVQAIIVLLSWLKNLKARARVGDRIQSMLIDILLNCGSDAPSDLLPLSSAVTLVLGGEYKNQFQIHTVHTTSVNGSDVKALEPMKEEEDVFVLRGVVSFFEDSHAPWVIHVNVASLYCALGL
ncbi:hypothetical protein CEUSTIGMA_g9578.t1 [Chlamydomonas eustigma]|uniref:Pentatricopeptide repeat-containing protein n=1 Tax=Chlamydomonas eustigma TaxID=1157962 RepID=A0A250XH81_9CHLO|nr:hypothetical protein CEUSTIGMA_g9578.t1 [Chlamydomonas eustigma]|eukprot:GAX82150.1 hypothetical protein CEUSTIGMA_g9578.t1 [Chlamydomonas eustigma]